MLSFPDDADTDVRAAPFNGGLRRAARLARGGYTARVIERRQQEVLRTLWVQSKLSRWELHEQTGLSPNTVGTLADGMLRAGLIRECPPESAKMGRPRVPLEIDPTHRHLLGLALVPGRAEIALLGLTGAVLDRGESQSVSSPASLVREAADLLAKHVGDQTLAIGITSPGFIDPVQQSILFSSALPGRGVEKLAPVFEAANNRAAILGNDMHALAARWLLTHRAEQQQDVLLVFFTDGRMGSAMLIDGRPNRGCVTGANELGHTRLPIETASCFCGQTGCLERICSTDFLHRQDRILKNHSAGLLGERVDRFVAERPDPALGRIIHHLAFAFSNTLNFLRPHRLVLVSPFTRNGAFAAALSTQIRQLVLPELEGRVAIDLWDQPATGSAENAGWLAMAELIYGGWDVSGKRSPTTERVAAER